MASVIEKDDGTVVVLVHLSLKPERDDALIRLVRSAPPRGLAGIVREAMRSGMGEDPTASFDENEEPFELPDLGIDL